jgi:hypothetical protein
VATDPALSINDAQVEVYSTVFAYARSLDVLARSIDADVYLLCLACAFFIVSWQMSSSK